MRRALKASYAPGATIKSGPASSSRRRVVVRMVKSFLPIQRIDLSVCYASPIWQGNNRYVLSQDDDLHRERTQGTGTAGDHKGPHPSPLYPRPYANDPAYGVEGRYWGGRRIFVPCSKA